MALKIQMTKTVNKTKSQRRRAEKKKEFQVLTIDDLFADVNEREKNIKR